MPISNLNFCRIFSQADHHMRDRGIFSPSYSLSKVKKSDGILPVARKVEEKMAPLFACPRDLRTHAIFENILQREGRKYFSDNESAPRTWPPPDLYLSLPLPRECHFPGPHTHTHAFPFLKRKRTGEWASAFLGENWKKKLRFSAAAVFHRSSSSLFSHLYFYLFRR